MSPPKISESELDPTARHRIITDIAHWRCELEETIGNDYPADELEAFIEMLQSLSDSGLSKTWAHTVGEWICSRGDCGPNPNQSVEDWISEQFTAVKEGNLTDYGFIVEVYVPPPEQPKDTPT